MYNLLVSSDEDDWNGESFFLETSRCVREHTEQKIIDLYGELSKSNIEEIIKFPSIFAYEKACKKDPKFGFIRNITKRQDQVRIEYEIIDLENFLSCTDIPEMLFELDINKYEMNRTHWAIKDVDLIDELNTFGIVLPDNTDNDTLIDITKYKFDVALSFPGEVRDYVFSVAEELKNTLGKDKCFYDKYYTAQLARPSLDTLLQDIYKNRAKLVVVFLCEKYQEKAWPNIEFRAIKDILLERDHLKIMYVKMDDGKVEGVFQTDGYVDGKDYSAEEVALFINERLAIIKKDENSK